MRKKYSFILIICLILIISSTIVSYDFFNGNKKSSKTETKSSSSSIQYFEIEIIPNNKSNYCVICPIPIISMSGPGHIVNEGQPISMLSDLKFIKGSGTYQMINTTYTPPIIFLLQ